MGWRGTIRTVGAAIRRAEREAARQQRVNQRAHREFLKGLEKDLARQEVQEHEELITNLCSMHKMCGESCDWHQILHGTPPLYPVKSSDAENHARALHDKYRPSLFDRLLRRVDDKRAQLWQNVVSGQQADEGRHQIALQEFQTAMQENAAQRDLAREILAGNLDAYCDVLADLDPFSSINGLGSEDTYKFLNPHCVVTDLKVNDESVVPAEAKSLLSSGKLSVKQMQRAKYFEIYQDYVCGGVIRIAREFFAVLPVEMVVATAHGYQLNSTTGYKEWVPIVSVAFPRPTFEHISFDQADPSDAFRNFSHAMGFKRSSGFNRIEPLDPAAFGHS